MRLLTLYCLLVAAGAAQAPAIALTHVWVIDGTGAPARADQTVVIENGRIAAVGAAGTVTIPAGATVRDLAGDTVLPGLVGMHEHMFYPEGNGLYGEQAYSFPRLYLAGGVTTIRTTGAIEGYADLNLKAAIDAGRIPGPEIFPTAPYLEGYPPIGLQLHPLKDPAEARAFVNYWASVGANNYKAYMHITHDELAAAIQAAHALHEKLTGHLCSVGFQEAAALGIDDLEHGFVVDTEFVPGKQRDVCPPQPVTFATNAKMDIEGPQVQATIHDLIQRRVAVTSTLDIFETFVPNRPPLQRRVMAVLTPEARVQYLESRVRAASDPHSVWPVLFRKEEEFEHSFAQQGGRLLAGLDPTGGGGIVAGYGDQRELELLVEAGFTPVQAVQIYTQNGARYLGIAQRVGTVAPGLQADLVVVRGNLSQKVSDIENTVTVYKQGKAYDPAKLIAEVRDSVGLH
ncbi:MAG TPA: amidohydrolase family protein [Terriglobales bacterium]|nr:amidohydrolase family protein [Terriglobales bacterium]